MITLELLELYDKYKGSDDWVGRVNEKKDQRLLETHIKDWQLIASFLQDLEMIKNKLVSSSYEVLVRKKIEESVSDRMVIERLYRMVL